MPPGTPTEWEWEYKDRVEGKFEIKDLDQTSPFSKLHDLEKGFLLAMLMLAIPGITLVVSRFFRTLEHDFLMIFVVGSLAMIGLSILINGVFVVKLKLGWILPLWYFIVFAITLAGTLYLYYF